jgi:excisionase family DNA binding protein
MARRIEADDELIEVARAAVLVGRHPETVRRWVWSGRLTAQRSGRRLLVARREVQAMAGSDTKSTLHEWVDRVRAARSSAGAASGPSAAELVIEDRRRGSGTGPSRAGR